MRIALVISLSNIHALALGAYMAQAGHEVHLLAFPKDTFEEKKNYLKPAEHEFLQGINIHILKPAMKSNKKYVIAVPSFARKIQNINPEIIVAYTASGPGFLCQFGRKPYVIYATGSDILVTSKRGPHYRMIIRRILSKAAIVFANGEALCRATQTLAPSAKVKALYHGVRTDFFTPAPFTSKKKLRAITTRGLLPGYNHEVIIHALSKMEELGNLLNVEFIAGGYLLEELKDLVSKCIPETKREAIRFIGGVATRSEVLHYFHQGEIFLSMSKSDGTSTSMLEAMACGLFPIVSDIPPNKEWIHDGKNGFLVPLDDPQVLTDRLRSVIKDRELRLQARKENIRLVQEKGDWNKNIRLFHQDLIRIVKEQEKK